MSQINLASRIRRARKLIGMSQANLARAIGVDRSCVGHWEGLHGTHPGPARLAELARVLVISYEWLATGRGSITLGHNPTDDIPASFGRLVDDPETLRLLRAWDSIPMRSRCAIIEIAEQLASSRKPKKAPERDTVQLPSGVFDAGTGAPVTRR
jgi:transcriptional regulator with XRE-family HTH domain